jgi:predicted peptidase
MTPQARRVLLIGLLFGLYFVGAAFPQITSTQIPVRGPGVHIETMRMGELAVKYVISIPKDYSPSRRVPLVLALHYGGSPNGAAQGLLLTLVQPALAELGAVIIAPESLGGGWDTPNNQRAVDTLMDAVPRSYSIDSKRIAVTGFSMGGTGTWSVVSRYPDKFSAAIPVAGMPPASMAGWRTPVFAVHSRNDEVMPIGPTEARIKELREAGVRAELAVLTGISHHETNRFVDGLKRAVPWLKQTWQ